VDINLKPLYRFAVVEKADNANYALEHRYENRLLDGFIQKAPLPVAVVSGNDNLPVTSPVLSQPVQGEFYKALQNVGLKQYSSALSHYTRAVEGEESDPYGNYYKAFYLMNRAVLRAEMIDFIASMESNVQTLTMDDQGSIRARVSDRVDRVYDYSEAIADMKEAARILPDIPYLYFNLGNLHCLSGEMVEGIENYDKAIGLFPYMGDAYFNRGLALIFLKDKEKGCIDLSRAGELGIADAYSVISKYCELDDNR
jgi:tetratricopeptide (TPR) repeat protein